MLLTVATPYRNVDTAIVDMEQVYESKCMKASV